MKITLRIILCILFAMTVVFLAVGGCYGFAENPSNFTDTEHIIRVTERFSDRLDRYTYDDGSKVESFTVYPLYNQNDKLTMFLIEMEPYGFEFVFLRETVSIYKMYRDESIYRMSLDTYGIGLDDNWERYKIDKETGETVPLLDKNNERHFYRKSPYYVDGKLSDRKYIIKTKDNKYIFAIKSNNSFINLISGDTIDIKDSNFQALYETQATMRIDHISNSFFDL